MIELIIIKHLLKLNNYNKFRDKIKIKEEDKELRNLYKILDYCISSYQRDITFDEYKLSVLSEYPDYEQYLTQISSADVGEDMLQELIRKACDKSLAFDLALLSIDVSEGRRELSEVLDFYAKFEKSKIDDDTDLGVLSTDVEVILQNEVNLPGLDWRLECLNLSLGPLRQGNFGHIFARIETGKTAMWVSEATYMASQLPDDKTLAIFFNEENGSDIILRMYSAMLGLTYTQVLSNPRHARDQFYKMGGDKIRFFDRGTLTRKEIEKVLPRINPGLIIIDNMDKMTGFNADRNDLVLWEIYKWGRALAKEYCPILSVGQADVSAQYQKWVHEAQMDGGKTGKPSETDFTIGIGRTNTDGHEFLRYLYISRNKLKGGNRSQEKYRHGKFEVLLKPEYSLYQDLYDYN